MGRDVTDENGTPPRSVFSPRALDRVMPELLGLMKGIICDGVVTDGELVALRQWIASHPDVCVKFPGNVIATRLIAAFADGIIEEEERADLHKLFQAAVGETDDQSGLLNRSTRLPINDPLPTVFFDNREFCLTGVFAYGVRRECEAEVARRGGRCAKNVTKRTHYLVIGLVASDAWVGSTHGLKIEHALHLRDELHGDLAIIPEAHWVEALQLDA